MSKYSPEYIHDFFNNLKKTGNFSLSNHTTSKLNGFSANKLISEASESILTTSIKKIQLH